MKYEYFDPGEIIFYYGDVGDKFFVIIQGSVEVWINPKAGTTPPTLAEEMEVKLNKITGLKLHRKNTSSLS